MKKILVATDLSSRSDRALDRTAHLAKSLDAEVHILHVIDEDLPSRLAQEVKKNSTELLEKQIANTEALKGLRTKVDVRFGHTWKTVVDAANTEAADLIVLGTHRNRGLIELFQGTTLDRVVRASRKPVLIAMGAVASEYKKVLVGVDFSGSTIAIVETAAAISSQAPLLLVHAYHIPYKGLIMRTDAQGDISQTEREQVEKPLADQLAQLIASLPKGLAKPTTIIREGGATTVIETEARTNHADLIVVGVHGRSGFAQALLGSTARELLSNTPLDLLIVPPRDAE